MKRSRSQKKPKAKIDPVTGPTGPTGNTGPTGPTSSSGPTTEPKRLNLITDLLTLWGVAQPTPDDVSHANQVIMRAWAALDAADSYPQIESVEQLLQLARCAIDQLGARQ